MPAQGLGSKYVVLGGITPPASARLVSVASGGGASVKRTPSSESQRRVSSSTRVLAGAISTGWDRRSRTSAWRISTSRAAPGVRRVAVCQWPAAYSPIVPADGRWLGRRLGDLEGGCEQVEDRGGVDGSEHPSVERRELQAVHRVDDAEDAGVGGFAGLLPRGERGRDPVVPVGDVVVRGGQLVREAGGGLAGGHPPHGLVQAAGAGEVEQGLGQADLLQRPGVRRAGVVQQGHQGGRGVGRRVVVDQALDPLGLHRLVAAHLPADERADRDVAHDTGGGRARRAAGGRRRAPARTRRTPRGRPARWAGGCRCPRGARPGR